MSNSEPRSGEDTPDITASKNKLINNDPQLKALRKLLEVETDQLKRIELNKFISKRIVELSTEHRKD